MSVKLFFESILLDQNNDGSDLREQESDYAPNGEIDAHSVTILCRISSVRFDGTTTRNENRGIGHPKTAIDCEH